MTLTRSPQVRVLMDLRPNCIFVFIIVYFCICIRHWHWSRPPRSPQVRLLTARRPNSDCSAFHWGHNFFCPTQSSSPSPQSSPQLFLSAALTVEVTARAFQFEQLFDLNILLIYLTKYHEYFSLRPHFLYSLQITCWAFSICEEFATVSFFSWLHCRNMDWGAPLHCFIFLTVPETNSFQFGNFLQHFNLLLKQQQFSHMEHQVDANDYHLLIFSSSFYWLNKCKS